MVYEKIAEMERTENSNSSAIENFNDFSISTIAQIIEKNMRIAKPEYCCSCLDAINHDEKVEFAFVSAKYTEDPSISTFQICKIVDRFLNQTILTSDIDFNAVYRAICENTDESVLFTAGDFSHNLSHKIRLVTYITNSYIDIKAIYIAQTITSSNQKHFRRSKFKSLIHFYGE